MHRRLQPRAEPDADDPRRRPRAAATRSSGSARPRRRRTRRSSTSSPRSPRAVEHIGGPVNLVGDCQGGWLATIYAALHPENVNTLTIAGAPDRLPRRRRRHPRERRGAGSDVDLNFFRALVALGDGVLKGEFLLGGFIVIKPENELAKQLQLLARTSTSERHVARYRRLRGLVQAHAGPARARSTCGSSSTCSATTSSSRARSRSTARPVDLGADRLPDQPARRHARPHHAARAGLRARRPRRPRRPRTCSAARPSGGHLGLFMGTEALRDHWPVVMSAVLERSQRRRRPRPRPRAAAARRRRRAPRDPRAVARYAPASVGCSANRWVLAEPGDRRARGLVERRGVALERARVVAVVEHERPSNS